MFFAGPIRILIFFPRDENSKNTKIVEIDRESPSPREAAGSGPTTTSPASAGATWRALVGLRGFSLSFQVALVALSVWGPGA